MKRTTIHKAVLTLVLLLTGAGPTCAQSFLRGDVNGDGVVDVADVTALTHYLYTGEFNKVMRSLSLASVEKTYGDADFTVTATALLGSDDGVLSYEIDDESVATIDENTGQVTILKAGTATITATISEGTNYASATTTATLTVSPKALTVTAKAQTVTYGTDIEQGLAQVTAEGLVSGDELTAVTLAQSTTSATTEGTITPSDAATTNGAANYDITYTAGLLTINPKEVTVASGITAVDKVYDGTTTATLDCSGAVFSGLLDGDELTVTATGTFADATKGTGKTVTISGLTLGGASAGNYTLAASGHQTTATASITAGAATITAAETQTTTYNGSAQPLTASVSGGSYTVVYYTDAAHTTGQTTTAPTNAGTYYAIVSQTDANYTSEPVYVTYTINKAAASISYATTSVTKTYGNAAFTNTLTKSGDGTVTYASSNTGVATVNASTGSVTIVKAGTVTITATVADGANYTYATKTATYTLTVNKAAASISYGTLSVTKSYGAAAFTNTLTNSGDGSVSYKSNNTSVATVNASGLVTIAGIGTAAITATVADGTNYTYAEKTATYTLTVTGITATTSDIGKVIGADGKIYATVSAATAAGTTASGMIAYVGNQNNAAGTDAYSSSYNHGLAIALTDVSNTSGAEGSAYLEWPDAVTAASRYTRARPSASSGWMLPSLYQWQRMFIGCGNGASFVSNWTEDGGSFSYGNFRTKLTGCGGTNVQSDYYWSSTEYGSDGAWLYPFGDSNFYWFDKDNVNYVRAVFAF